MKFRSLIATPLVMLGVLALAATPALAAAPEKPETKAAEAITGTSAVLPGVLNPAVEAGKPAWYFAYSNPGGTSCTEGPTSAYEPEEATVKGKAIAVHADLTGLEPSSKYTFCLVVVNELTGESEVGNEVPFETSGEVPKIEGESVSEVTHTDARLHATVNPNSQTAKAQFKLGLSTAYSLGGVFEVEPELVGFGGQEVSLDLFSEGFKHEELQPNTEYHYEAIATNPAGTVEALTTPGVEDQMFLTLPKPPSVATGVPSVTSPTTASIAGTVNPNAVAHSAAEKAQDDTAYYVEYGGTNTYGLRSQLGDAGEGESLTNPDVTLEHLQPGASYHYRFVASNLNNAAELNANDAGEYGGALHPQLVYGADGTFTTPPTPPSISGASVTGVTQSGATISATLEPNGLPTRYELQLGQSQQGLQPAGSGTATSTTPVSFTVGSLSPATTYYYKLVAVNQNSPQNAKGEREPTGPTEVREGSFTTGSVPAPAIAGPPVALVFPPSVNQTVSVKPTIVTKKTTPAKCAKGKKRKHGKCVKVKKAKKRANR